VLSPGKLRHYGLTNGKANIVSRLGAQLSVE